MRDAIIAIPCAFVLLAFYGRYLLAGGTAAGLRAFVVIAVAMGLAGLAWVVLEMPRHAMIRDTINHWAHHRGQMTVYLRLMGAKVPALYGPSADDQRF